MITIAIVDDKMINRKTVRTNLGGEPSIRIVLEASDGADFLTRMIALPPDDLPQVVLMDIDMPGMNGIDAIAVGTIRFPGIKFLVLTIFDDDDKIFEAIQAGAVGYLLKDDSAIQLADAIREALEFNGVPMSRAIARKTLSWLKSSDRPPVTGMAGNEILSVREMEIMLLMVEGRDYKHIATQLFLSPHTVRKHISRIYEKLHINSRAQAVQLAHKYKWIS